MVQLLRGADLDTTNRVMKEIMDKVRSARERAGLTQLDVASALSIRQQTYNGYETGARTIGIPDLTRLPAILGCRITDLLPDSVVTDYDRARARDEQLDLVVESWPQITDGGKDAIVLIANTNRKKE